MGRIYATHRKTGKMKLTLNESITILAYRVEKLRKSEPHWKVENETKINRIYEALEQVKLLLGISDILKPSEVSLQLNKKNKIKKGK